MVSQAVKKEYKVINVLLPLAIPREYSYKVEKDLWPSLQFGIRVEVPLRNKLYSAVMIDEVEEDTSALKKLRFIRAIIDEHPIITRQQYDLWNWMSSYYTCTLGEVMNVALPSGLKLNSETKLIIRAHIDDFSGELSDKEYILAEAISIQNELTISQVQDILDQKTVYPYIKALLDKGIILIKEELKAGFKVKTSEFVRLNAAYTHEENAISQAFDLVTRSEKQTRALLSYAQLGRDNQWVDKKKIYNHADVDNTVIKALVKKGIFVLETKEVSRISNELIIPKPLPPLNEHQVVAKEEILKQFESKEKVLLFGVTGSGKTRIYIDLIKETLARGEQVLYLLPEIALTTQIVDRLMHTFAIEIGVYHSKMSNNQRVELWQASMDGKGLIMGARSAIFLPFKKLGLIIIDEEHDPSFKQSDPAPRYNGRDTAIYLASLQKAKVLLGTATPSLDTYLNTYKQRYGLVKLMERHGASVLPKIEIIDLRNQYKKGLMRSLFSKDLKDAIDTALAQKEQVLIFQNRRGYSPTLQCTVCDFHAECPNCDVSLTVHKYFHELRCHYCGYRHKLPHLCPQCGFDKLDKLGFGTEKIEDEIKKIFPQGKVARMDLDTAKTKNAYEKILSAFKQHEIDILVGTQMITKGLDFDNISVVGVLAADKILFFPDFKANERAFQLFTQVAGRAGRRAKQGRVIIQTFNPQHPVIRETRDHDHVAFYARELKERKAFVYPPFYRLISLTVKHKKPEIAEETAKVLASKLRAKLGNRVMGPSVPGISRVRGFYIQNILIKMEKKLEVVKKVKALVLSTKIELNQIPGLKSARIIVDVDP